MGKYVSVGVGASNSNDPKKTGEEAVKRAIDQMKKNGENKLTLGILFCSGGKYGQDENKMKSLVESAHREFVKNNPKCNWLGCTTTGELTDKGYARGSCVAMAIGSEYIRTGVGIGRNINKNPKKGAKEALQGAMSTLKIDRYIDPYMQFITMQKKSIDGFVRYSPFHLITICQGPLKRAGREDEVIDEIEALLGTRTPVVGGSSADDYLFTSSYQFLNGKIYKDSVIVMALISHIKLLTVTKHGLVPTDKTFIVTKCDGRVVHKLNGKPAAEVLAKAYNSTVKELSEWVQPGFQRCFFLNDKSPPLIVEGPGVYKPAVFHMIQGNDVILGTRLVENTALSIGKLDKNAVINSARDALKELHKQAGENKLAGVILFDCCMRERALGKDVVKEVKEIKENAKVPLIGYYTYGEQTCLSDTTAPVHTNFTFTTLGVADRLVSE